MIFSSYFDLLHNWIYKQVPFAFLDTEKFNITFPPFSRFDFLKFYRKIIRLCSVDKVSDVLSF